MNVQEYISSGILEQYVLNGLSKQERLEVEQHAARYPEIRAELDALEDALMQYAQANAIPLRAGQSESILGKIDDLQSDLTTNSLASKRANTNRSILPVLMGIALAILSAFAIYLNQQNQKTQAALEQTQQALAQQRATCDSLNNRITFLEDKLAVLTSPDNATTIMRQENSPVYAAIHRNTADQIAYLDVSQLPPPPAGKQYQLWFIDTSAPESMGVFDLADAFIEVDYIATATIFAISLEDEGGSAVPTDIRYLGSV
ncbi:MAG: anti-sigma factor [Bacteroidota bacterium]